MENETDREKRNDVVREGESFEDSEYDMGSESSNDRVDKDNDKLYQDNIDIDVDWVDKDHENVRKQVGQDEYEDDNVLDSKDDYPSGKDSDGGIDGQAIRKMQLVDVNMGQTATETTDAIGDASIRTTLEPYSTPNPASSTPVEAPLRHVPSTYEQFQQGRQSVHIPRVKITISFYWNTIHPK
ncbi:hypothetical protein Pfo_009524 [Paulownia fortunei]|nr:hypothetical protein Pfo_009524 [Paulownia fortunei]